MSHHLFPHKESYTILLLLISYFKFTFSNLKGVNVVLIVVMAKC